MYIAKKMYLLQTISIQELFSI